MPSERTMQVAEALYQRGILSYPRTETDLFSREFDIQVGTTLLTQQYVWYVYYSRYCCVCCSAALRIVYT
jgi:DNA topoisomerase III